MPFDLQVIARGAYVDEPDPERRFIVEVITVRLNVEALNAWFMSDILNCRECYESEAEWQEYHKDKMSKRVAWEADVRNAVGLVGCLGGVHITQALAEVFTIVHIHKIS